MRRIVALCSVFTVFTYSASVGVAAPVVAYIADQGGGAAPDPVSPAGGNWSYDEYVDEEEDPPPGPPILGSASVVAPTTFLEPAWHMYDPGPNSEPRYENIVVSETDRDAIATEGFTLYARFRALGNQFTETRSFGLYDNFTTGENAGNRYLFYFFGPGGETTGTHRLRVLEDEDTHTNIFRLFNGTNGTNFHDFIDIWMVGTPLLDGGFSVDIHLDPTLEGYPNLQDPWMDVIKSDYRGQTPPIEFDPDTGEPLPPEPWSDNDFFFGSSRSNVDGHGEYANIELHIGNILVPPPSVPGDYNGNGIVDAADYVSWRRLNGQSGPELDADGTGPALDGTPDGMVDDNDYLFWRMNFGNGNLGSGGASILVPEPGLPLYLLFCGLALIRRSRK